MKLHVIFTCGWEVEEFGRTSCSRRLGNETSLGRLSRGLSKQCQIFEGGPRLRLLQYRCGMLPSNWQAHPNGNYFQLVEH